MATNKERKSPNFITDFCHGGISAAIARSLFTPSDVIRSKLIQVPFVSDTAIREGSLNDEQVIFRQRLNKIKQDGVRDLWRGNVINLVRYVPSQAFNFAFKDCFKRWLEKGNSHKKRSLVSNFIAGGLAGPASLAVVYSFDQARLLLASDLRNFKQNGTRKFNGIIDVYKKTMATDGIPALYKGFAISCLGAAIYRALYFGIYDSVVPALSEGNFFMNLFVGWVASVTADLASYPVETIRRRMMMTSSVTYDSSLHCAREILANEGSHSLFKGASNKMHRSILGAGVLVGYDKIQKRIYGNEAFRTEK